MDETIGLRLIEDLKNDPEKFCHDGKKSYQLLQEYFNGLSKDTLRELFHFENKFIRQYAIWITSELGRKGTDLLKEVVPLINDSDYYINYHAMQIVAGHANGKYFDEFITVISFLEHSDPQIRLSVMHIISGLSGSRIHEAYAYLANKKNLSNSHEKGLLSLTDVNALNLSEITQMVVSDIAIIRKYGIIAAKKLYKKYPQIINEAVNNADEDVRGFSKWMTASRHNSGRSPDDETL